MVVVIVKGRRQAFYRSTGRNSGQKGEWFPFDGATLRQGSIWFDKEAYTDHLSHSDPLFRWGTEEMFKIGKKLNGMDIPEGKLVETAQEVNLFIHSRKSLARNKLLKKHGVK